MNILPRVFVIDDLIGSAVSDAETRTRRKLYCRRLGLVDEERDERPTDSAVATAVICGGQREEGGCWVNSLEVVVDAFRRGWPNEEGRWWSAVLVDMKFGNDDRFGLQIIAELHAIAPEVPILVVSSLDQFEVREGETLRKACERIHAEDFLAAPGTSDDAVPAEYRSSPENLRTRLLEVGLIPDPEQDFVGYSLPVCRMLRTVRQLIHGDLVGEMLLLGEAGSGKTHLGGYVRREIARHRALPVNRVPYTPVPLSGTALDLQKKSLLGTAGATGVPPSPGAFEVADRGLVFLDEIGHLHPDAQADLLPILQPLRDEQGLRYRPILRMGADRPFRSHAFVVAATNEDLDALVERNRFSRALLQRFTSKEVLVPPLRDRIVDLPLLVANFVRALCRDLGRTHVPELAVPQDVWVEYAQDHSVRELEGLIKTAINRHPRKTELTEEDIFVRSEQDPSSVPVNLDLSEEEDQQRGSAMPDATSISDLVARVDNWAPSATTPAEEYWDALAQVDRAVGRAKLRLLRDLLEKQQGVTRRSSLDLKAAVRVLLGDDQITNTKPGDVAYQIFKAAGVTERPDDPILAEAWDKRRLPNKQGRSGKDSSE